MVEGSGKLIYIIYSTYKNNVKKKYIFFNNVITNIVID
jgi:hypothetical protein